MAEDTWLDADDVGDVVGADLAGEWDSTSMQAFADGARSYVEERRRDLFVPDGVDPDLLVFAPTPAVRVGAAMLAYRLYARRTAPLGVIGFTEDGAAGIMREDPDIARMLGIGRHRGFVFGGAPLAVT